MYCKKNIEKTTNLPANMKDNLNETSAMFTLFNINNNCLDINDITILIHKCAHSHSIYVLNVYGKRHSCGKIKL